MCDINDYHPNGAPPERDPRDELVEATNMAVVLGFAAGCMICFAVSMLFETRREHIAYREMTTACEAAAVAKGGAAVPLVKHNQPKERSL